jgi:hypothetical protein
MKMESCDVRTSSSGPAGVAIGGDAAPNAVLIPVLVPGLTRVLRLVLTGPDRGGGVSADATGRDVTGW